MYMLGLKLNCQYVYYLRKIICHVNWRLYFEIETINKVNLISITKYSKYIKGLYIPLHVLYNINISNMAYFIESLDWILCFILMI